jgi:RNA polymerase sigma-70 factor (ECF subfamily)
MVVEIFLRWSKGIPLRSFDELNKLAIDLGNGSIEALDPIWDLCADELFGLALYRTGDFGDAQDAVQDVFVRLARKPKALARADNPRNYLRRMAHNAAVDVVKRRRPADSIDVVSALGDEHPSAETGVDAKRAVVLLAHLPAAQRVTVFLRHFEDLSFREIGVVMAVPTFTAASRYRLAMRRLKKMLGVEQ